MKRDKFSTRIGFLLVSAGCAIGLGNIWRFPYIVGYYGGAVFLLIYFAFLLILGLPLVTMELAIGRGSGVSIAHAFGVLAPKEKVWSWLRIPMLSGNYLFMMFYSAIGGWTLYYTWNNITGAMRQVTDYSTATACFSNMQSDAPTMVILTVLLICILFFVCSVGMQKGVEKVGSIMLAALFVLLVILAIYALTLPGAREGIRFYLVPDPARIADMNIWEVVSAAMGQAFYTLGIGIGTFIVFGSYIEKKNSLVREAISILLLDTMVAFTAGLIIFPACFTYGIDVESGPNLLFLAMPVIFGQLPCGRVLGSVFFLMICFAAVTTMLGAFECIIAVCVDHTGWSRKKASALNAAVMSLISLPCIFGFNIWRSVQPMNAGSSIMDLEDFIVSNNLLPIGCLITLLFCTLNCGWGWKRFRAEANIGNGLKFPDWFQPVARYVLPALIVLLVISGYVSLFKN